MHKFIRSKTSLKLALFFGLLAIVITTVFLTNIRPGNENLLAEALEGGELTLDTVGRSHESLNSFVMDEEQQAGELLKAALVSQEYAKVRLTSSRRTDDNFVLNMLENYWLLLNSSYVMTQGVDNLLVISDELKETLYYYGQGAYEEAAEEASLCLQTLTPLASQFELWNQSLDSMNYLHLTSGPKERVKNAVFQYQDEMGVYLAYIHLLENIAKGVDYLNEMENINNLFDQLQHAIATNDYETAQRLIQEILDQLQLLKDPKYQNIASDAAKIDSSLLEGAAFNAAQDLESQLKDLEGIEFHENYLKSIMKYTEALRYFEQGNLEAAEESIQQGLSLLEGGGEPTDSSLQKHYEALEEAFNSLRMQIRGQPNQG